MKASSKYLFLGFFISILFSGCNTLDNIQTIDLEVFVPATIILPFDYQNVAVRYNNSNFTFDKWFTESSNDKINQEDTLNVDSIAFVSYYNSFLETIQIQQFFDSVNVIQSGNYSGFNFSDSLLITDSVTNKTSPFKNLASVLTLLKNENSKKKPTRYIDPELGLYTKKELVDIADSTHCDILLSLDLFSAFYGIEFNSELETGLIMVYNMAFWNFYDLAEKTIIYQFDRIDTILWQSAGLNLVESMQYMPEMDSAVIEAAAISGISFAEYLVPHWTPVQRMYYKSGNIELKMTEPLIKEGKWLEAAKIWKANINNENKKIAAKSMFNLALACEMEGDLDAAIDWAVRSYHIFGQDNKIHAENCQNYIRILSVRKRDLKIIDYQFNEKTKSS